MHVRQSTASAEPASMKARTIDTQGEPASTHSPDKTTIEPVVTKNAEAGSSWLKNSPKSEAVNDFGPSGPRVVAGPGWPTPGFRGPGAPGLAPRVFLRVTPLPRGKGIRSEGLMRVEVPNSPGAPRYRLTGLALLSVTVPVCHIAEAVEDKTRME